MCSKSCFVLSAPTRLNTDITRTFQNKLKTRLTRRLQGPSYSKTRRRCRPNLSSTLRACTDRPDAVPAPPTSGNGASTSSQNLWLENELQVYKDAKDPIEILKDARTVEVKLPIDAYLEESIHGQVFVDELVPGGNAEKSGVIAPGDVIVAVSLPFGDGLLPVPRAGGIDMIQEQMENRDESEPFFHMALVESKGVEELRREIEQKSDDFRSPEEMSMLNDYIYSREYPIVNDDIDKEQQKLDLEYLKEAGFDMSQ